MQIFHCSLLIKVSLENSEVKLRWSLRNNYVYSDICSSIYKKANAHLTLLQQELVLYMQHFIIELLFKYKYDKYEVTSHMTEKHFCH